VWGTYFRRALSLTRDSISLIKARLPKWSR